MVQSLRDTRTLNDGNQIPVFGFGCYNAFGDEIRNAVRMAIESGYCYIDSATFYKNEDAVGLGLQEAGAKREEIFVLSKTWPAAFDRVEASVANNLKNLRVDYLDAMLLHWPGMDEGRRLHAVEQSLRLQEKGCFRTFGVSNFQIDQLEKVHEEFGFWPAINELELHPAYQQRELVAFCREHGIQTIAYSPIARGAYVEREELQEMAKRHGKTATQLVLRWHIQKGNIPIPKSSHKERIEENAQVFDFCLSEEELACIDALEAGARLGRDPYSFPPADLV